MWGNDKKNTRHNYDTLISSKTEIVGDIEFSGGLHIDGKIKGCVVASESNNAVVRISDHGIVEGEVRAPHVIINGQVLGDVFSTEHVELAANASVTGTVHYNLLEMVMGAQVNGSLVHEVDAKPVPRKVEDSNRAEMGAEAAKQNSLANS